MKTKLIIGFFIVICVISFGFTSAMAQSKKEKIIPATHMWIMTGNAVVFVPVNSLQQCQMLTQQASAINSSESNCYNGTMFVKNIRCTKSTHQGGTASCS